MQELFLGIDICDDYSLISYYDPQIPGAEVLNLTEESSSCMVPTVICKEKGSDSWLIGMEAYSSALYGKGTMVDKLVKLLAKKGTATIDGVKYTAQELMSLFIRNLLSIAKEKLGCETISSVTFSFQNKEAERMEMILSVTDELGIPREQVHMANHAECYLFYVLSQPKALWNNQACLFDLTENGLHYYELDIIRGRNPQVAEAKHEELEEGFSLEILETQAGRKLGDTILTSCADRLMRRKVFSSVFLTGKGFEEVSWAKDFTRLICSKRRVFSGPGLFASGAAFMAFDHTREVSSYPYICLCEGRLMQTVSLQVQHEGRERQLILAQAGSDWYESKARAAFIPDGIDSLTLYVTMVGSTDPRKLVIDLSEFPERPRKTTRIQVHTSFLNERRLVVQVEDKGFGEFFPGSGETITRVFDI